MQIGRSFYKLAMKSLISEHSQPQCRKFEILNALLNFANTNFDWILFYEYTYTYVSFNNNI